jgi:hypothetical protein
MSEEYRIAELAKARESYLAARAIVLGTTNRAAKREAELDMEFWGNKMAALDVTPLP